MTAASIRRFTVEEYHRLAEVGVLHEDERVELLNGVIVPMVPIGPFHGGSVKRLVHLFERQSRDRWITSAQDPLLLGPNDEPQPDLMLLKPDANFYCGRHPEPQDVFLLIEVADSTLLTDRQEKLPIYARAGIPEVWIVNLPERVVEVYSQPTETGFAQTRNFRPGDSLSPSAFSDVTIDTLALLTGK